MSVTISEWPVMTMERYLLIQAVMRGAPIFLAKEAIATTAMEHPEWDLEEERTWREWEATLG